MLVKGANGVPIVFLQLLQLEPQYKENPINLDAFPINTRTHKENNEAVWLLRKDHNLFQNEKCIYKGFRQHK